MSSGQWASRRSSYAHWGFYAYAVGGVASAAAYVALEGATVAVLLEAFIVAALSVTLLLSGKQAREGAISPRGVLRAVATTAAAGASFALLALAIALIWTFEGHPVVDTTFMVVFATGLGLAVGAQGSLYAVSANEERRHLADLVKLLTMNERVLRHNLRNELALVVGHLDNVAASAHGEAVDADVRAAKRHVDELVATSDRTRRMFDLWRTDARRERSAADVVAAGVEQFRADYPAVTVNVEPAADGCVVAHPALPDAFYELLVNAVEHNDCDVAIDVTVEESAVGEVVVRVADDGCGIPSAERVVFDRPTETDLSHGSGLGIWLAYWLVRTAGGSLDIHENEPHGTVVEATLPVAPTRSGVAGRFAFAVRRFVDQVRTEWR